MKFPIPYNISLKTLGFSLLTIVYKYCNVVYENF